MTEGLYFWRCPKCQREYPLNEKPSTQESCRGGGKDSNKHPETPMQLFRLTGSKR
jgi:hypothetical protein